MVFCLPETLYHRNNQTGESRMPSRTWLKLSSDRKLKLSDFTHVFIMLAYPSVVLPGLYYAVSFGLGSVLFAVTGAAAFGEIYHFDTAQVGMAIGLSTFIGTLVGELSAGPVSDRILYLQTKRSDGAFRPEARLQAIWPGFILCPAGVIIEGVCLQYETHWSGPVLVSCNDNEPCLKSNVTALTIFRMQTNYLVTTTGNWNRSLWTSDH